MGTPASWHNLEAPIDLPIRKQKSLPLKLEPDREPQQRGENLTFTFVCAHAATLSPAPTPPPPSPSHAPPPSATPSDTYFPPPGRHQGLHDKPIPMTHTQLMHFHPSYSQTVAPSVLQPVDTFRQLEDTREFGGNMFDPIPEDETRVTSNIPVSQTHQDLVYYTKEEQQQEAARCGIWWCRWWWQCRWWWDADGGEVGW